MALLSKGNRVTRCQVAMGNNYRQNWLDGLDQLRAVLLSMHYWGGCITAWWRHQMETFSASLVICDGNPPVTGGFPSQRRVTQSFDVFFDLRLNKRLSKQSRCRWFETISRSLWRHCNGYNYSDASRINTLRPNKIVAISQTTFSTAFSWMKDVWMSIKISLRFVPKVQINNIPALVQIMHWCHPGDWSVLVQAIGWVPSGTVDHVLWRHMVSLAHNESNRCCAENSAQLWYHKTTETVANASISKQFDVPANYPKIKEIHVWIQAGKYMAMNATVNEYLFVLRVWFFYIRRESPIRCLCIIWPLCCHEMNDEVSTYMHVLRPVILQTIFWVEFH